MGLELVVHSTTMRSGYFHFGNNHFFVKFQLFKYVLKIFDDSRDAGHKQYSGGYVNAIQDLILINSERKIETCYMKLVENVSAVLAFLT